MRYHSILLKSKGMKSKEVSRITGMSAVSFNNWLKRYKEAGIEGLSTKSGRGRNPVISKADDSHAILAAVKGKRQRMRTAKAQWEKDSGKKVSDSTISRTL
jgi:transposase